MHLSHFLWAAAMLTIATPAVATDGSAVARFQALYTREWNWRMEQFARHPGANAPVSDHLPRVDAAAEAGRLAYWQEVMKELDAIPRDQLPANEQVNYDVYRAQLQVLIDNQRFRS